MKRKGFFAVILACILAAAAPSSVFSEGFLGNQEENEADAWVCGICGELNIGDFCTTCGTEKPGTDEPPVSGPVESEPDISSVPEPVEPEPTEPPVDRYVRYTEDYCNKSAADAGFTSYDGRRCAKYGDAFIDLYFVTAMGEFLDVENQDALKEYEVVAQNIEPGTEIRLEYMLNDEGKEFRNLVDRASVEAIDLLVKKWDDPDPDEAALSLMVPVKASPDRYTYYVRSYVGKNLASVGYFSDEGELTDDYGHGSVLLKVEAEDGTEVDPGDRDWMSEYVVTGQSVEPNTEIKLEYAKTSYGEEYRTLIESQSVTEITLTVAELPEEVLAREIGSGEDGYDETDSSGDDGGGDDWNEGNDEPDSGNDDADSTAEDLTAEEWPSGKLPSLLMEPAEGTLTDVFLLWDSFFEFTVRDVTLEQFEAYVEVCKALGFDQDLLAFNGTYMASDAEGNTILGTYDSDEKSYNIMVTGKAEE